MYSKYSELEQEQVKKVEFSKKAAASFDDGMVESFLETCVMKPLGKTVDTSGALLADLNEEGGKFGEKELGVMKKCVLRDIKYSDISNKSKFKIEDGKGDFILFSNRNASNGELRADVLRSELDALKKEKPGITLYDALNELVRAPRSMAPAFVAQYSAFKMRELMVDEGWKKYRLTMVEIFANLGDARKKYIEEGRKNELPDKLLKNMLKKAIEAKRENIIADGLDGKMGASDDFFKLIKEAEKEEAQKWINDVRSLAERTTNEENGRIIQDVANSASYLLTLYDVEDPKITPDVKQKLAEDCTKDFDKKLRDVQHLKIEKISRMNVLNVFLFIPSIVNLIRTGGKAFWLRSDSKIEVGDHLKFKEAPIRKEQQRWKRGILQEVEKPEFKRTASIYDLEKSKEEFEKNDNGGNITIGSHRT